MYNNKIRMVTSSGIITTVAGTGTGGISGDGGAATSAKLQSPAGVAVNSGNIYIADMYNNKIRIVNSEGIITTFAGTGMAGSSGDGGAATSAQLNGPIGVAIDSTHGNLYIADSGNFKIRMMTSAGIITTIAGTGISGIRGLTGAATSAQLNSPVGVAVDSTGGIVYVSDQGNSLIRMINSAGIITTFAGTGTAGSSGDGGAATAAQLSYPTGVAIDSSGGAVYIADYGNNKIRMVNSAGIITTIAGTGAAGSIGDGGAATSAQLNYPYGVAVDGSGNNIFIADLGNADVRLVVRGRSVPSSQPAQVPIALTPSFLVFVVMWFLCAIQSLIFFIPPHLP